jgi:hypothetical protein
MPNWVENHLAIKLPENATDADFAALRGLAAGVIADNVYHLMPEARFTDDLSELERRRAILEEVGPSSTVRSATDVNRDWVIHCCGCLQGIFFGWDFSVSLNSQGVTMSFHSKWYPPDRWVRRIATLHPTWMIHLSFAEEMNYYGWTNWNGREWEQDWQEYDQVRTPSNPENPEPPDSDNSLS